MPVLKIEVHPDVYSELELSRAWYEERATNLGTEFLNEIAYDRWSVTANNAHKESAMEKNRIGISACLLGENVRYDGGHRHDPYLTDALGRYFAWAPVCPEVEYGLGIPREAMRLEGDPEAPRLVTIHTRVDHTEGMLAWAAGKLDALAGKELCGFIFKKKSPSSGMAGVKVYNEAGIAGEKGMGIFAGAFMKRFPLLPVEEDGRLHDPVLRENFIERIFVYRRRRDFQR